MPDSRSAGPPAQPASRGPAFAALAIAIAAAIGYSEVPVEALIGFPLDPATTMLSDLAAQGQPTQALFVGLEVVGGVLAVVLAVMLWARARGRIEHAALVSVALLGVCSAADGMVPLPCSHSTQGCTANGFEGAGFSGEVDIPHSITSVGASVLGVVVAVVLVVVATGRLGARPRPRGLQLAAIAIGAGIVITTALVSWYLTLPTSPIGYYPGTGWVQRIQSLFVGAALVLLAPLFAPLRAQRRRR